MSNDTLLKPSATLVPEDRREMFLPTLFGLPLLIVAENAVYTLMDRLSPQDYGGGFWNFYEIDGQPLFLAPTSKPRFRIESEITEYRGEVSAEAAGIIATLFAFSHLSFRFESDFLAQGYERLYGYLDGHPEASAIFQAID
ncbi:antirestriction protein [Rhizorhabdus sp.]|uniref:antirestriction protein n=1 Tax=Rhizorhabdus sp. TaxID=1968843 RepID=UPI0035B4CA36